MDEDGQMGNPENWTSEQIDEDNHSVSHRLIMNSISLRLSYRVWDNLSLWAGIGTTNFTHEETFRDDDDLSSTIFSKNMVPIYSGGLGYGYAFTDRFFMSTQPGVRYANSDNMTTEVYYQGKTIPLRDLSLNRRYLEWAVPVVAGYALGKFRALCRDPLQGLHDERPVRVHQEHMPARTIPFVSTRPSTPVTSCTLWPG